MIFNYDNVKHLNDLEYKVYEYVIANSEKVSEMKIRELSTELHISTATILRFCKKMGFVGFSELKVKLKFVQLNTEEEVEKKVNPIVGYLHRLNTSSKNQLIKTSSELAYQAKEIIFLGCGTSGILAKYGYRYFISLGKNVKLIDDPFYPYIQEDFSDTVVIVLTVSGETPSIIDRINFYKKNDAKIISITNTETSTIATKSDITLAYYVPKKEVMIADVTTQLPTLYFIENIGKELYKLLKTKG